MTLRKNDIEQDKQVEVGTGKIDLMQHIVEIVSLDSAAENCDVGPTRGGRRLALASEENRMSTSRRSVLAGAGLASMGTAGAADGALARSGADQVIAGLIERSATANAALMRGDIEAYRAPITLTDDFTLMSPFGGAPTHGREMAIERAHVDVGALPAQDWSLRVTLVYRREAAGWQLAHRHADPLVKGNTLDQSAELARG